jgi:hypothetical protein
LEVLDCCQCGCPRIVDGKQKDALNGAVRRALSLAGRDLVTKESKRVASRVSANQLVLTVDASNGRRLK